MTSSQRIGFVGLGLMGHGMAKNIVAKGFPLTVIGHRNRAPVDSLIKLGAREAKTAADLAATSDIVFICVTGSPQVEETIYKQGGIMDGASSGLIVVDSSTSEPGSTMKIAADLAKKGTTFVDAPLARTPKEAEEGKLNVMVGADAATFAKIEPVLKAFAENIFHVGALGAAHKLKLINNFMAMGQATVIAEAAAAAAKVGVDLDSLVKLISAGAVNSGIFQMMMPPALKGDLATFKFGLANARKDLSYYTHMTEEAGVPSVLGEAVHQTLVQAAALGLGDKFVPSLLEAQERINGIKIVRR
ncbi:MAG TPA: NAD(P)-dependent oxidoreductase [Alphaproteobacteria bacterium]|nr:NAD(P)-dependent oxidoreductase [Alphaproteobacteria bacterium]